MVGEFISKALVMILGYAYPALECFKTLEKNRVDMNDLRFWCQYWIIVALLSVCERFGDIFISWLPLYEELKLAFIIYLWYPKTKGTSYVYDTLLRPLVSKHETDIERHLKDLRLRAWDLALYYWQNCTDLGQGAFFQVMDHMLKQSQSLNTTSAPGCRVQPVPLAHPLLQKKHYKDQRAKLAKGVSDVPPPSPIPMEYFPSSSSSSPSSSPTGFFRRWRPALPTPHKSTFFRSVALSPNNADKVELEPDEAHIEYVHVQSWTESSPKKKSSLGRLRLGKNKP